MKIFTKAELIDKIRAINQQGWIHNTHRIGNNGAIGNLLEDLLGIEENKLPIPNAAEWELKAGRISSTALTSLFHLEPSPTALRFVPSILLPKYGWRHQSAGMNYPDTEMSFRQTIRGTTYSDRGFTVKVDEENRKVVVSFDAERVNRNRHGSWIRIVESKVGLNELEPQPYWGFSDLGHKAGIKLKNMFYVTANRMRKDGQEFFHYNQLMIVSEFDPDTFIDAIRQGYVYIDFDARTGHNHGTKFRIRSNFIPQLYKHKQIIDL
jgi:hypothetical protein